ncbi:hypothetical protein M1N90_02375 [Dehalococcoidia bacterium]|nr:hypothetical protein [Dehalococcoidia bacterium]
MNIYFDTDYTIIAVDGSLRPGVTRLFSSLIDSGDQIFVWSGNGIRWKDIDRYNLRSFVTECMEKPVSNYMTAIEKIPEPLKPDIVIDDNLEIVAGLGGIWVNRYYFPSDDDCELDHVATVIEEIKSSGTSHDQRYRSSPKY